MDKGVIEQQFEPERLVRSGMPVVPLRRRIFHVDLGPSTRHRDIGICFKISELFRQPPCQNDVVLVLACNIFSSRKPNSAIEGRRQSAIGLPQHREPSVSSLLHLDGDLGGPVWRSIDDDYNFKTIHILREQGRERLSKRAFSTIDRDNRCYGYGSHSLSPAPNRPTVLKS